jgi:hypothetical protein
LNLGRFSTLFMFYTVDITSSTGYQPVARPLLAQTQNERTQTSMSLVGYELTIPVFDLAKTIHALDRAVTVIGDVTN